jgi:Kef-type K+ transport system membrane component KefB
MILLTLGFVLFLVKIAAPPLRRLAHNAVQNGNGNLGLTALAVIIVALLCCAIVTNLIGIFAVIGAFLFGAVLSTEKQFRKAVEQTIQNFVAVFFLPIFFTYTGLRTNVGLLGTSELWLIAIIVWLTAILGKFGGCSIAARITGFSSKESLVIGTMMNTRGLMELIVINIGYDLGVIPPNLFTILVLMAILTTVMTTPLIYLLKNGTELERQLQNWWNGTPNGAPASAGMERRL